MNVASQKRYHLSWGCVGVSKGRRAILRNGTSICGGLEEWKPMACFRNGQKFRLNYIRMVDQLVFAVRSGWNRGNDLRVLGSNDGKVQWSQIVENFIVLVVDFSSIKGKGILIWFFRCCMLGNILEHKQSCPCLVFQSCWFMDFTCNQYFEPPFCRSHENKPGSLSLERIMVYFTSEHWFWSWGKQLNICGHLVLQWIKAKDGESSEYKTIKCITMSFEKFAS